MKRLKKQAMAFMMLLAMANSVLFVLPARAQAATNQHNGFEGMDADVFTALGFDVTELPEDYDPETTDNPFGRDKITGNQIFELVVGGKSGSQIYGKGNNNVKGTDISGIPTRSGVSMEMSASAAADFDGDGLAGEIIYIGYESLPVTVTRDDSNRITGINTDPATLQLQVYNGRTESYGAAKNIGTVNVLDTYLDTYEESIDGFLTAESALNAFDMYWQNLLQVSAGDYDGDGISEIAVYVAEKGSPRIDVYKYQKKSSSVEGDWIDLNNWKRVWSHALGGEYVPNMVSLVSGDFNRDGIDDLAISYGSAVFKSAGSASIYASRMDASQAVMLWGDRAKMLQNSSPIDLNTEELGEQVRVSLIKGDLNEDGVEELIATGQPLSDAIEYGESVSYGNRAWFYKGNTQRTIITYVYDNEAGLLINSSDLMKPVDGEYVTATVDSATNTQWKSNNGFDDRLPSEPFMRTNAAVFRAMGADYPYLYLDSCLYQYSNGALTLLGEMDEKYDGQHSLKDKKNPISPEPLPGQYWGGRSSSIGGYSQAYYAEYGAASADINGSGYGILGTSSFTINSKAYDRHITQYAVLNGTKEGLLEAAITNPEANIGSTAPDATSDFQGVTLTFIDCDIDTIIMEYTGQHYLTYSDPKVLAVIAAAPYFEDVDEATGYEFAGNNTTSWGRTHGDSHGDSVSVSVEFGAWAENTLVTATGQISLNGGLVYTLEWEKTRTLSHEYTMTFGTYGDQDAVAFYSIPTENYIYRVYVPNEKDGYDVTSYVVSNTFDPAYQVLTLDYYESIQGNYDALPPIRGKAITSTPGDPSSYPSSPFGYRKIAMWDRDAAGVGFGNGSIEQEISISSEEEISYSMGAEFSFELGGGLSAQLDLTQNKYESTGGMQFAINPAGGWSTTTMKGTTIAAEVANMPVEFQQYGYYFDWKLFSYYYTFGDLSDEEALSFNENGKEDEIYTAEEDVEIGEATSARIPVITYIVNNVSKPPQLPDDFQQDYDRTTSDSNVMTWTYGSPCTAFIISKYFDFPVGGGLQEIARIEPGDSDHYRIKYDEDGKPYKEYFFTDTNLSPYTEYEYAIQVERLVPPPPLSTPSALTPARTKAANGYPKISIAESDDEQDQKLLVYPDRNAYLTAGVTGPEGENIGNYYSVVQYQWQKREKGAWVDMVGETNKTLTFVSAGVDAAGDYRCRVNVITKADNTAITAYSDSVELLHAKRGSYMKEVSVTDVAGGGIQLYAEVANAHRDSASIPGGSVTFNLISNSTGETYMYIQPLTAAGSATAVVDQILPEGMYTVKAYYAGSYIFKACAGEALYLSQRAAGYDIDLPSSVTYGDEAQIVFREANKSGGVTTAENVNAEEITMYMAAPLSRAALSGAVDYDAEAAAAAEAGTKYRYTDAEGIRWYFTAPVDGVPSFDNGYALFGNNLQSSYMDKAPGEAGIYLLQAGTPTGFYRITMKAAGVLETAAAVIEVRPRQVIVQIPQELRAGESDEESAEDITFSQLSLVGGSWADCDIEGEVFKYADVGIEPEYYNTAGALFSAENVRKLCGAYSVIGTKQLDNYNVIYRSGQLTVLGAAYDVEIGARPFDGLNVGKVYMVAPETGVAAGPLGSGEQLNKQIQAGVRMVFSAQPDDGYEIYDWYINGKAQGSNNNTLVYTMMAEPTSVEAQFAIRQNTLSFGTAGDANGGTLSCEPALTSGSVVRQNSHFTFTAQAKEGYHFKEWRYTEQGQGTSYDDEDNGKMSSSFDFYMPNNSCSLYAVFERDGYIFNYIDGNNAKGLTATYENEEGKLVTARSGAVLKGGTVITVAPAAGYLWDGERQYVSQGSQGRADYAKGSYTLTLDRDTTVYGWTKHQSFSLTLGYELDRSSEQVPDASITYYIGDQEYSFSCAEFLANGSKTIENIPGGTPVTVAADAAGWLDLLGWTGAAMSVTASTQTDPLAEKTEVNGELQKGKSYFYRYGETGASYYFVSPVNGRVRSLDGEAVTLYASAATYSIPALGQDEELAVGLREKAVHTVSMADISGSGTYQYELPAGGFYGTAADSADRNTVNVHDGDDFTVTVIPDTGKTVSYWTTTPKAAGASAVTRPATSLRYTIPSITMDYDFEPIFSTTTYNLISWPTISESQNKLTLNPESGYISSVSSGGDFKFRLSGGSLAMVDKVFANGHDFTAAGNVVGGTTYKAENGVYSILNLTENQEITVSFRDIGVTVNDVDISALSGLGWSYDHNGQTLTLTRTGLTLSGANKQDMAPALRIVAEDTVSTLTLNGLNLQTSSAAAALELRGEDVIVSATGNNSIGASSVQTVCAAGNLTFRGNGVLDISTDGGFVIRETDGNDAASLSPNSNTIALYGAGDLTVLGTVKLTVMNTSHGEDPYGISVDGNLTVGADNAPTVSPVLHAGAPYGSLIIQSYSGRGLGTGAVAGKEIFFYGGESSFSGSRYGLQASGLDQNVYCYGGILEASGEYRAVGYIDVGRMAFMLESNPQYLLAYYPQGYMCRYYDAAAQAYKTITRLQSIYNAADRSYDTVDCSANFLNWFSADSMILDDATKPYLRLSPQTSSEGDDLILSVAYNGRTYSRSIKDSDGDCLYYIDASDTENTKLRVIPYYGSNIGSADGSLDGNYAMYPNEDIGGKLAFSYQGDPDYYHPHDFDPAEDIIVAENYREWDTSAGAYDPNGRHLYFNVLKFVPGKPVYGEDGEIIEIVEMPIYSGDEIVGYYYYTVAPSEEVKLDYTVSGTVSGEVTAGSRGAIYGDGQIFDLGFYANTTDDSRTDFINSLTLDNLTHVNLWVGNYPVYLKGDNYLIGSVVNNPLTVVGGDLDLRSSKADNGTLTISAVSGQYGQALGLQNGSLRLTDVAALTLMNDGSALSANAVTYAHAEGDVLTELPYGLGWLEEAGSKAGDALALDSVLSITNAEQHYVRFYTTSTDPKAEPAKLIYDKSDSELTVSGTTLTPPTVMGVPHLFTPLDENSGCKAELIMGAAAGDKVSLIYGTDYTYAPDSNNLTGKLTLNYAADSFKAAQIGEYSLRVYFYDEDGTDATVYTLDIPLTVQDTKHVVGDLAAKADRAVFTRGTSANIGTEYTGATPKLYVWRLLDADGNETLIEGITLTENGSSAAVTANDNAPIGPFSVRVTSYADSEKEQQLGEATVDFTVAPKAVEIAVSCVGETPSGDESYMIYHNTLDGQPRSWDFDAAVTMDDGSEADAEKLSWTLWGGVMNGTAVDRDGILSVNPNETGLLDSGYLLLTACYTNDDETKLEKTVRIRLSEDAVVGYAQAASGGVIAAPGIVPGGTPVPKDTVVTFTATPEAEYAVDAWYINGQAAAEGEGVTLADNKMSFTTEKMGRYSVWATFTKEKVCGVNFAAEGPGTIMAESENGTLNSGEQIARGSEVSFTAVPEPFAKVTKWSVSIGGEAATEYENYTENTLTLSNITDEVEVKVEFAIPDRSVSITVGENGSVSFLVNGEPAAAEGNALTVKATDTVTVLAVPDADCSVKEWSGLKNAAASDAICTVLPGMEDAEATVSFEKLPVYQVKVSANSYQNGWGSVECGTDSVAMSASKLFAVTAGHSLALTAVPEAGCTLYDWSIEPADYRDYSLNGTELILTNINSDVTVSATFRRGNAELSLTAGEGGSLQAAYKLTLPDGTNVEEGTLTANGSATLRSGVAVDISVTPDAGYVLQSFSIGGEDSLAALVKDPNELKYVCRIEHLDSDTEVEATFAELLLYDVIGHADYYDEAAEEAVLAGTARISGFDADNGYNTEVSGAEPQTVRVTPGSEVEITFAPAEGYVTDTDILSEGVKAVLQASGEGGSKASFSFKQSAAGTILVIEGVDADLDFSALANPFVQKGADDEYVTLYTGAGDNGKLTVSNAEGTLQYLNGATLLKNSGLIYKAEPNAHYAAFVTVNGEAAENAGELTADGDTQISADFEQSEYKLTLTVLGRGSGTLTVNGAVYAPGEYWLSKDAELSIRAEADANSAVSSFLLDGAAAEGPDYAADVKLSKDMQVIVSFSNTMRTVTYNTPTNGTLKVLNAQGEAVASGSSAAIGSKLYIVAVPDAHYKVKTLSVGGTAPANDYFVVDEERGNDVFCEFDRSEVRVSWRSENSSIEGQLMPEGSSIANGQYVPSGANVKFVVTAKSDNYSQKSFSVSGAVLNDNGWYSADQTDIVAEAVYVFSGDAPDPPEPVNPDSVRVTWLTTNCNITAELENGIALKNGDYVKIGDRILFTHTPAASGYKLDKFTVIGAEADGSGYYVAGTEDIVANAVYNASSSGGPITPIITPSGSYTVSVETAGSGTVTVTNNGAAVANGGKVALGSTLIIKAEPAAGQKLLSLTVNGVDFVSGEAYVVYANTLIRAEFAQGQKNEGLPCYKDDLGNTVYTGFSYDLNGDGSYDENEYIIPAGVKIDFRENHKYFADMPGNWADEYIQFVGDREIFQGVTDTLFDPEGKMTRAMYVTVIGRLYERSFGAIESGSAGKFTDCDYSSWYGKYVDWAAANGVVNGYDAATFGPNDYVTREQMTAILVRFARLMGLDTAAGADVSFTDADSISGYATDCVSYCVAKGIINGYDDGRFGPQDNATRAQVAAVIVRYVESVLTDR